MDDRSKFAGGDQAYLRDEQYKDASRLAQRANLHSLYSTSAISWFDFVGTHLDLGARSVVLEVGCGAGWLWAETSVSIPPGVSIELTDLSPGMVEEAVGRVAATGRFGSVAGQTADLQALPVETASFDRVVANHMLYHVPDPALGVVELARVVKPDGVVMVATNGRRHMQELWRIRGDVFSMRHTDRTIDVFGAETGFGQLRDHFGDVRWIQHRDTLRCTDPAHVLDYVCSTPPAEDADADQLRRLEAAIAAAFDEGGGVMSITKDVGAFLCRQPRPDAESVRARGEL